MNLKEQILSDTKDAMRSGDTTRRDSLRMLMSAIKEVEKAQQATLENDAVEAILRKQAKQRRESITDYEKAGRAEMAAAEQAELVIIETYLPKMMSEEEVTAVARDVIAQVGASTPKDTGKVMGLLMKQLKGKADGSVVSKAVRGLLQPTA